MSSKEKKADNAKKKRGTDKGKQYVKSNYPVKNESRKRVIEVRIKKKSKMKEAEITDKEKEELEDVTDQLDAAVIAHGNQSKTIKKAIKKEGKKNCGCGQDPCKTYGIQEHVVNEEELDEGFDKDKMKCNSPRYLKKGETGYGKKQKVVKACKKGGKEKIVKFGDANMENRSDNPSNKKNFRSRHNCGEKKDKFMAGYWSCKDW